VNLEGDVDRMLTDVVLKDRVFGNSLIRDEGRIVQRLDEGERGRRAVRVAVLVLHVQRDLRGAGRAEDGAEEEDEDDREGEGEEGPYSRAQVHLPERRHVRQDSAHSASTPSCICAPTTFRNTSSRLPRLV